MKVGGAADSVVISPDVGVTVMPAVVVVGVGDRLTSLGIEAVVGGVGTPRRRDDRVGDVAIDEGIVDAGDGDGLRRVPVGGR